MTNRDDLDQQPSLSLFKIAAEVTFRPAKDWKEVV
jgi:hypothetical protein